MSRQLHLFHIGYSEDTASSIEAGFNLLDNLSNPRPDWFEIWPISHWLENHALEEDALYGFFSPKFRQKTGLGALELRAFAAIHPDSELLLFSPQPDVAMPFRSVFHGGERFNPGYFHTAQKVINDIGTGVDLNRVVMDSTCSVFSNYLVATPRFWCQWLSWIKVLIDLAERNQYGLNDPTGYGNGVHRKVFVAEGFSSLLAWGGSHKTTPYSPFSVPWYSQFSRFPGELIELDALKMAYRLTGKHEYLVRFDATAEQLISKALRIS